MIRKTLTLFGVLALLLSVFAFSGGNAHAKSSVRETVSSTTPVQFGVPFTAPVDFGAVQKTCPYVSIHLNGVQHTLICHKTQGVHPGQHRRLGKQRSI